MAFRKLKYLLGANGVAAGQTATAKISVGERFHGIDLFVTDNGVANSTKVNEVRLSMGGSVIQKLTRAELLAYFEEDLNTANAGHIPIAFSVQSRANVVDQEITAWDTDGESDFEIQVDFDATATNPSLKLLSTVDNGKFYNSVTKQVQKRPIRRLPLNYNPSAGWTDITNLPNANPITAIRINTVGSPTVGDILAFEVLRGGEKVMEGTYAENAAVLEALGFDTTKWVLPIIFDRDRQIANALDCRVFDAQGRQTGTLPLTLRLQMASAKPIKVIVDQVLSSFN